MQCSYVKPEIKRARWNWSIKYISSVWHRAFYELSFGEFAQESSAGFFFGMTNYDNELFGSVATVHETICSCHTRLKIH